MSIRTDEMLTVVLPKKISAWDLTLVTKALKDLSDIGMPVHLEWANKVGIK